MTTTTNPCHESIIELDHVSFSYGQQSVFKDVHFQVLERDFVGLIGANGAGKTTMLRMIVGLTKPKQGEIRLFGTPITRFKDWERIGYVPQKNSFNPLFPATVREVVTSGLYSGKRMFQWVRKSDHLKVLDAMEAMGIAHLQHRRIGQLSGGQQQRVFLAKALVNSPDLLILDEPTVGIDAETQRNFFHLIQHMRQHHNITFLMVSHDLEAMHAYLGNQPEYTNGGLNFYVRHSHDTQDCKAEDFMHSIKQYHLQTEQNEGMSGGIL